MQQHISVLTGDVISSSKANRDLLLRDLKVAFDKIASWESDKKQRGFELYRGDSFQGIVFKPENALKYAIMIRAHLRKLDKTVERDARIAIGIGSIDYLADSIAESDGEAFRNSGPVLDTMKNGVRVRVKTPWEEVNEEMEVTLVLADALINRWSASQAEVVAESLEESKQTEIALKLGISQSAVNQRLKSANWEAIEKVIERFATIIEKHIRKA